MSFGRYSEVDEARSTWNAGFSGGMALVRALSFLVVTLAFPT